MNRPGPFDFTFDEVDGLQCPNCQGYRVKSLSGTSLHVVLIFLTFGMWLLVYIPWFIISALVSDPNKGEKVQCKLCGYQWVHREDGNK